MAYPTKLLGPGEEVAAEAHPHWSVLIRPVLVFLLVLAACVAVIVLFGSAPVSVGYGLAGVALIALCWLGGKVASWRARLLVITNRRVVYRSGVLRRVGREIPLERIQDVTYDQSLLERILGTGSLLIESAGASGQEPFPDVRRPARMQSLINRMVTQALSGWPGGGGPAPVVSTGREPRSRTDPRPPPPKAAPTRFVPAEREPATGQLPVVGGPFDYEAAQPTGPLAPPGPAPLEGGLELRQQLRDLEELHEAGVLTDAEFDAKRRELLGF